MSRNQLYFPAEQFLVFSFLLFLPVVPSCWTQCVPIHFCGEHPANYMDLWNNAVDGNACGPVRIQVCQNEMENHGRKHFYNLCHLMISEWAVVSRVSLANWNMEIAQIWRLRRGHKAASAGHFPDQIVTSRSRLKAVGEAVSRNGQLTVSLMRFWMQLLPLTVTLPRVPNPM